MHIRQGGENMTHNDAIVWHPRAGSELLARPAFIQSWRELAAACPWSTVFQSPDFIVTWYETYGDRFDALLVTMTDIHGTLCGLLTLAIDRKSGALHYAGCDQAEYQVWLATGDAADDFPLSALNTLKRAFPRHALMLQYLPPNVPMQWLDRSAWFKRRCVLRPSSRPLVGMNEEEIACALKSRTKQRGLKGLRELGEVSFGMVAREDFARVFAQAWPLYEFRQIGKFNFRRFLVDPSRERFYRLLAERTGVLQMSVLRVDDQVVAWLTGVRSDGYFHPTAFAHSPFHARFSPGGIHMLLLAQSLMRGHGCLFDLTPGGDAFKDMLASEHEPTWTMVFYPGPLSVLRFKPAHILARKAWRKCWRMSGERVLAFTRRERPSTIQSTPRFEVRRIDLEKTDHALPSVRRNEIRDLLKYQPAAGEPSMQGFFVQIQQDIDTGADLFTYVENERLIACASIIRTSGDVNERAAFDAPAATAKLVRLYIRTGENRVRLLRACLIGWTQSAPEDSSSTSSLIAIPVEDEQSARADVRESRVFNAARRNGASAT